MWFFESLQKVFNPVNPATPVTISSSSQKSVAPALILDAYASTSSEMSDKSFTGSGMNELDIAIEKDFEDVTVIE